MVAVLMKMNEMKKEARKGLLYLSCMALSIGGFSQAEINIELEQSEKSGSQQCVSLTMSDPGSASHSLSSQNYRIYYGADNLKLNEQSLISELPEDIYQLRLVQHVDGVDASGRGGLDFENNLGFINFAIVHSNLKQSGTEISSEGIKVASMCFEVQDFDKEIAVVFAREEVTSKYGRAYVDISTQNSKQDLLSTTVNRYDDLIIR